MDVDEGVLDDVDLDGVLGEHDLVLEAEQEEHPGDHHDREHWEVERSSHRERIIIGDLGLEQSQLIISSVAGDHDEHAGADTTNSVNEELQDLKHFKSQVLLCLLETVEFNIRQDCHAAELGEDHQDEESNSNVVDSLS